MSAVEALPSSPSPASLAARDAAHGLFERHSSRILGFCVRRLNTREEAEDAVQTVFVNALRALQRGVVPVSEEAWLFKIAENVCNETHRANGRRRLREVSGPEDLPDPVDRDPEAGREVARELMAALGDLPDNQRRALLLREWRGFSYKEIATDLRCTVGAVETMIFRARRNVAQALSQTRTRVAGLLDLGSLAGALKTMLGGATAAKIAAAAAVVTVATLPAGDAPQASANKHTVVPTSLTQMPSGPISLDRASASAPTRSRADERPNGAGESVTRIAGPSARRKTTPGAPSQPGANGQAPGTQAQSPLAPITEEAAQIPQPPVQVPPPPQVQLPEVPQVPQLPELPSEIQLPELPVPLVLPVEVPTEIEVPQLPKLP
jgi:RNA polymerase sigma-70 factor (ECF subfamily)